MSIWVTGAKGFIGGHLARELAGAGHAVHGIGHGALEEAECRRLGLQAWINGEVEAANLDALAAAHGFPSAVFHLAGGSSVGLAIAHPLEDFSRTVASTARLLEWLRVHSPKSRLIAASSAAVYGSGHSGPISEAATLTPMSPYGQHKLMMEQLCRSYATSYGINSTAVRLFSVYGMGLRKQLLWDICSRLQESSRELVLGGTGEEIRDWCDVRDVVRLLAMFAQLPQGEPFRVINGGSGRALCVSTLRVYGRAMGRSTYASEMSGWRSFSLQADDTALRNGICVAGFSYTGSPTTSDGSGIVSVAEREPRRVAFTFISRRRWAGGYNYQLNLFTALARYCPEKIVPVLFAGTNEAAGDLAPFSKISGVEVVQSEAFDGGNAGLVAALVTGIDSRALNEFEARRIDVVFESARFFGWRLPVPALAWFPDFQHRKLPQLFSPFARWRRETGFRVQIASRRNILLSSESALADFRAAYPSVSNPVAVARFATEPSPDLLTADIAAVIAEHRLPEKFFYLPNQFWRHKNHPVVIEALTILKQRGVNVVVAASGSTDEPRKSDYFSGLMRDVAARGIEANFRYLGLIPLAHVYALLRSSMALINPSRFEGWSTTVEEAKSSECR